MKHRARITVFVACSATVAAVALAGCSSDKGDTAAPTTQATGTAKGSATTTGFPEPPPYTFEVTGNKIQVLTNSADPKDLENTFFKVVRTVSPTLSKDGLYVVQVECGLSEASVRRLANGRIPVGQALAQQLGGFSKWDGVVPGAHCP